MKRVSRKLKRNAMLAVAVSALAAGVVVASATAGDSSRGPDYARHHTRYARAHAHGGGRRDRLGTHSSELDLAAGYLEVTRAQLRRQLQSGRTLAQIADATPGRSAAGLIEVLVRAKAARVSAAAGAERLSPTRAQARLVGIRTRITLEVNGARAFGDLPAAASYLGLSAARLRQELRAGRSLAQVAGATHEKSAAGLIDALASSRQASIEVAVASGTLTHAAASTYLSELRRRITREVNRTRRAGVHARR